MEALNTRIRLITWRAYGFHRVEPLIVLAIARMRRATRARGRDPRKPPKRPLYGPGATDEHVELVRKRKFPLVGRATGHSPWVHPDDAASASVLAMEQQAKGVFKIADDEPAPASEWLPYLARVVGGMPPMRVPKWLARTLAGETAVIT